MKSEETRDSVVGETLWRLGLPPERPGFFESLRAGLREHEPRRARGVVLAGLLWRRWALVPLVLAALLVGGAIGAAATRSEPAAQRFVSPVLSFVPAAGWNVVTTAVPPAHRENLQIAWTANVPLAGDDAATTWPIQTAKTLPPDGIVVYASATDRIDDPSIYPSRELPLELSDGYFLAEEYENQPARNVSVQIVYARVGEQYVLVHVWFGVNEPSAQMRAEAEAALGRLVLPTGDPTN